MSTLMIGHNARRTPQRIDPSKRRCWGKQNRSRLIRAQADDLIKLHQAVIHRNAMGLVAAPTGLAFVAAAETMLGKPYRITGCRCEPGCCCEDCSGEVCLAANLVGLPHICTTSFAMAISARELGNVVPFQVAIHTPGMILIRGPHNGEGPANGPSGSNGHVVICKGDGATTVEAMGTAYGIVRGSVFNRGFDDPNIGRAARFPGIDYSNTRRERTMIVQQHHYKPDGSIDRPTAPPAGKDSTIEPSADGSRIESRWDASIDNDIAVKHDPQQLRYWTSPANPLPPGVTFIAVSEREPDPTDPRPAGVAILSNGDTRRFHLS